MALGCQHNVLLPVRRGTSSLGIVYIGMIINSKVFGNDCYKTTAKTSETIRLFDDEAIETARRYTTDKMVWTLYCCTAALSIQNQNKWIEFTMQIPQLFTFKEIKSHLLICIVYVNYARLIRVLCINSTTYPVAKKTFHSMKWMNNGPRQCRWRNYTNWPNLCLFLEPNFFIQCLWLMFGLLPCAYIVW